MQTPVPDNEEWTFPLCKHKLNVYPDVQETDVLRIKLLSKPLFGLSCLIFLAGCMALFVWMQHESAMKARHWVAHTQSVINNINQLSESINEAESAQRGYILTENENFLPTYNQAANIDVPVRLEQLIKLVEDNPEQTVRAQDLAENIKMRMQIMAHVLELVDSNAGNFAVAEIKFGAGQEYMAKIHTLIHEMRGAEEALLKIRVILEDDRAFRVLWLTYGLGAVLVFVIGMAFLAMQREFFIRRAAERSLQETLSFQRAILDNSLYTIIVYDIEGKVRLFNPAAEKLLGYASAEVIGRDMPEFFDPAENEAAAADLAVETGQKVNLGFPVLTVKPLLNGFDDREWNFIHKTGRLLNVQFSVSVLKNKYGQTTGFMGIAKDITERRTIERMKNEFISTVSHELRTPLTSIRGALGLIVGNVAGEFPEQSRRLLDIAYKNTERLVRLINNILDIERIESGRMIFDTRPVEVRQAVTLAVDEMTGLADRKEVKIVAASIPEEVVVIGDQDRLLQVIDNLLSNAIKYSPTGGQVTIGVIDGETDVTISVTDNGPGIPESFWPRIFTKFAQADSSATRQKEGSGLGLPISKAIIESMKGSISFVSRPGETTFLITLPNVKGQEAKASMERARTISNGASILICEDDPDVAELLKILLEKEGYACATVHTATEARSRLASGRYAAMTLDLGLPDQDGISFIRELRLNEATVSLPIIVVSGKAEQGKSALKGDLLGVLDWLPKPIDADRLRRAMKAVPKNSSLPKLLHVEDDNDLVELLRLALADTAEMTAVSTLLEARLAMARTKFDFAILDIFLPDGNGSDLLPDLAADDIPVVILSVNETSREIQQQVAASLVKSVVPETKIIRTIKALIGGEEIQAR